MSVSSIGNLTAPQGADSSLSKLSNDYQSFMTLLVAQVKNQDPLEPLDATQFVSQLSTLTQVEQSVKLNDQLSALRSSMALSAALSETVLIGRDVTVPAETLVNGPEGARFSFETEADTGGITALITDAEGNVLRQITGLSSAAGVLTGVDWDGRDDAGNMLPEGEYGLSLTSADSDMGYNTYATRRVESISYAGAEQLLNLIGGGTALSGDIRRIE
ncbi:flagellar hook assembly protein FlgD [Sulfitobacter aestuarii]|uniref:Basal-body rod modification protein FlgD n=1 Tax=Sulfitobacter aestuarii TaxID=2161676 RepID=A0ABW5U189_9RHOB